MSLAAQLTVEQDQRLRVDFKYSKIALECIRAVPGNNFVGRDKGGPYWRVPLSITTLRRLRQEFGEQNLTVESRILKWERREQKRERQLGSLSRVGAESQLTLLPKLRPDLYEFMRGQPYQLGDAAHMAAANLINANDVGLGKTVETIGAVYESGLLDGPHLVLAPKTLLETPWVEELERWTNMPVLWTSGDDTPIQRKKIIGDMLKLHERGIGFWLITNPDQLKSGLLPADMRWNTATIDEFHDMGLANPKTIGAQAAYQLNARRRWANSGTPLGGRPIRFWGGLHYTYPRRFPSLWRWAREWLEITPNGFGHEIRGLLPGLEPEFDSAHAPYMVRHTTREVKPHLPKVRMIDVWCTMAPTQRKLYKRFAEDAEVRIDGQRFSSMGILDEYTRLKMLASTVCQPQNGQLMPTPNSCKLPKMIQRLKEHGIHERSGRQAIIASQFRGIIELTAKRLEADGFRTALITGNVTGSDRAAAKRRFQSGECPVMCMTTQAGGLGLTLDRADSVHILDETWDPDDQHQVIGRTRYKRPVIAYFYRTRDTIEEYVQQVNIGKRTVNHAILDLRRQGLRAVR